MDTRKDNDPTLVCTCNDLYIADIEDSIAYGEDSTVRFLQFTACSRAVESASIT